MFQTYKNLSVANWLDRLSMSTCLMLLSALVILAMPVDAFAQSSAFNLPIVSGIGCTVALWLKGSLAVVVFIVVAICIFIVGLISKMDWSKLLFIIVIYGLIQGFVTFMISSGYLNVQSMGCSGL